MSNLLSKSEKQYVIDHFRILDQPLNDELFSLEQLLDEEFVKLFIEDIKVQLKTPYAFVAASQLMKRIGYLFTVPGFYSMTVYNKALNLQLTNCELVNYYSEQGVWLPHLRLKDFSISTPENGERYEWRESVVEGIGKDIARIITTVSTVSSVPKPILWENVAVYMYWLYEQRMGEEREDLPHRDSDFCYLVQQASPQLFNEKRNPFKQFYKPKKQVDETRLRRTCCFYYAQNQDGTCCSTCPKSEQELKKLPLK
ncbi:hypothetical protein NC661_16875 [Aquibacillus koreensis]|uniref:Ferric siderophore reductase C-terminal domain-containing protein n=1 Tax=Aquibacillus koreensis TaxID=279446 RepID=A0A9X4AL33_9BACI|nr:IucA/IucC family C-terminal-domain containing protein [Aquibacillus koreensis]MCT2536110.1 hypothetical protein [Aquibacillus koreensis]MDC3422035.1 hypothetical protein [Aquibacillus koreensis]